ncbi:DEKNAAC100406 [Brettanomyces naardenensis]|uniref:Mediator of RNA polymerase II transcription subunit 19 n=1 Tax=Brettanomyces naardenensis TaxID=13370 RepID=A0A448YF08_BRENA|nr:DEKNAAC100406 [Brettanomyces naardenensis]
MSKVKAVRKDVQNVGPSPDEVQIEGEMEGEPQVDDKTEQNPSSAYYYIDHDEHFDTLNPSLRSDVIRLYGLLDLAQSLARTTPDGSKGVKLRKSYKNHIADLPGKYTIPADRSLSPIVCTPDNPDMIQPELKPLDVKYLEKLFNFDKSSINGIPGFDASKLAIDNMDGSDIRKKRKASPGDKSEPKRRHVRVRFD